MSSSTSAPLSRSFLGPAAVTSSPPASRSWHSARQPAHGSFALKSLGAIDIYGQRTNVTVQEAVGIRLPLVFIKPVLFHKAAHITHRDALNAALAEWA